MYFRKYRLRKTRLDKCLESPVLEDHSTNNMVNEPKHGFNLNGSTFTVLLITGKVIELEKVTLSDMQSLETVC